jgi:methanethiol S-methyltransferase
MLGFIMAFWATPTMTAGHLLFAVCTIGYILVAVHVGERDLAGALFDAFREYRSEVAMLLSYPLRHTSVTVSRRD